MSKLDEIIYIKDLIPQARWYNRTGPAFRGHPKLERGVVFYCPERERAFNF